MARQQKIQQAISQGYLIIPKQAMRKDMSKNLKAFEGSLVKNDSKKNHTKN